MRDFFKTILNELKDNTGLDQVRWLRNDCETEAEFDKRVENIVNGMMVVSEKFDYIPPGFQQKYIRKMMIEDQNYDSLNSRVIWKWLDAHKGLHFLGSTKITEDQMMAYATPEEAEKYIAEWKQALSKIGNPEYKNGMTELRKSAGFEASYSAAAPRPSFIVGDECPNCKGLGYGMVGDPPEQDPCLECDLTGKINRYEVHATNQVEADKAFQEAKKQKIV